MLFARCVMLRRAVPSVMSSSGVPEVPPDLPAPARGAPLGDLDDQLLEQVAFDSRGLVTAVVQDAVSRDVLMVAHMDREALGRTIATGRSWFFSRSRQELWCKGETSGDRQYVREVRVDCDGDAVVLLVDQHGEGACHTKEWTCFYRVLARGPGAPAPARDPEPPGRRQAGGA